MSRCVTDLLTERNCLVGSETDSPLCLLGFSEHGDYGVPTVPKTLENIASVTPSSARD